MGNAAGAAGLAELMGGGDGRAWFARAADRYHQSWEHAPPESWGRPIGAIKARILAGDWNGAADDARADETFPSEVADALAFLAADDAVGYVEAVEAVLESFETRDEYLEDMPVADTVLVLQALAARRGMAAKLESELLP